jgi:hypothetical protein
MKSRSTTRRKTRSTLEGITLFLLFCAFLAIFRLICAPLAQAQDPEPFTLADCPPPPPCPPDGFVLVELSPEAPAPTAAPPELQEALNAIQAAQAVMKKGE